MSANEPTRTDFKNLEAILKKAYDNESAWFSILSYAKLRLSMSLQEVARQDFRRAIVEASEQVTLTLALEPLPRDLEFLYFGLYDAGIPGEDRMVAGYYISGGHPFDSEDLSCIENVTYFPSQRLIRSHLLDGLKRFSEREAATSTLTDYLLGLPAACIITKGLLCEIGETRPTLVGFDEGDFLRIQ